MKFSIRSQRLLATRPNGRVVQFPLPKPAHIWIVLGALGALFIVTHPLVRGLLLQGVVQRDSAKMSAAGKMAIHQVMVDAKNTLSVTRPPMESQIPSYRLEIDDNTLQEMLTAVKRGDPRLNHEPGGNKPYFKALLARESSFDEVKICLRGTMFWHHRPSKPSFRVKLKKANVHQGDRYYELTTPEDALALKNWLPMELAKNLGLMVDGSRHVRLFINNKYYGVYVQSARQGEPFALANGRMPGTFFKAEFSPRMWSDSTAWKWFGQQEPADQAVLQKWLDTLNGPATAQSIEAFSRIFDTEKFARWAALMTVVGSVHTDDTHNHSYFFCSNQGKLEALPWDCNGYGIHVDSSCPVDVQIQPVLRFLSNDPRWIHRRNQWIQTLIDGDASIDRMQQRITDRLSQYREDLNADRNLGNLERLPGVGWHWMTASVAELDDFESELVKYVKQRNEFLRLYLGNSQFAVDANDEHSCVVSVFGNAAVKVTNRITGGSKILYPGLRSTTENYVSQSQPELSVEYSSPAVNQYVLEAPLGDLEFRHGITGREIDANVMPDSLSRNTDSPRTIKVDQFTEQPTSIVELGPGTVNLQQDLMVGANQSLNVLAGTELVLGPGVGIYSRGQVTFSGTSAEPILVRGASDVPWAAIGVAGYGSAGTRFSHVHVAGGSTGKLDELRFKGMLNVYDCPDVSLTDCEFGENFVGDDAVNLAESSIRIDHCRWENARADALDLDMCTGRISNCHWNESGNDGLDLMSCQITVNDSSIFGSGDKGISVGENSRLLANRVTISKCDIGTEIKDDSVAKFEGCAFNGCRVAVHSYQKKWFYRSGGEGYLVNCHVRNSIDQDVQMKSRSKILLVKTDVDDESKNSKRVEHSKMLPANFDQRIEPEVYWSE